MPPPRHLLVVTALALWSQHRSEVVVDVAIADIIARAARALLRYMQRAVCGGLWPPFVFTSSRRETHCTMELFDPFLVSKKKRADRVPENVSVMSTYITFFAAFSRPHGHPAAPRGCREQVVQITFSCRLQRAQTHAHLRRPQCNHSRACVTVCPKAWRHSLVHRGQVARVLSDVETDHAADQLFRRAAAKLSFAPDFMEDGGDPAPQAWPTTSRTTRGLALRTTT